MRQGKWKLIEFYEWNKVELCDLEADLAERNDLSNALPDKTEELLGLLHAKLKATGAQKPVENPDYPGR